MEVGNACCCCSPELPDENIDSTGVQLKNSLVLKRCLQFSIALGIDTPGTSRSGCQSQLGRNLRRLGWDESSTSPTDWSRLVHSMFVLFCTLTLIIHYSLCSLALFGTLLRCLLPDSMPKLSRLHVLPHLNSRRSNPGSAEQPQRAPQCILEILRVLGCLRAIYDHLGAFFSTLEVTFMGPEFVACG